MHHIDDPKNFGIRLPPFNAGQRFDEMLDPYAFVIASVLFILFFSVSIWGLRQTEWAISRFFTRPGGIDRIRLQMKADQDIQLKRNKNYCADPQAKRKPCVPMGKKDGEGIQVLKDLFSKRQQAQLDLAIRHLLSNEAARKALEERFGTSLHELDAVIIPAGDILIEELDEDLGITPITREMYRDAVGDPDYDAFTARDHADAEGFTDDGRPRIILNQSVFGTQQRLKRQLFHEALHALNVPKHDVSHIRHDLFYLQEYREAAKLFGREDKDEDFKTWVCFVIAPFAAAVISFRVAFSNMPRRRAKRSGA